VDAMQLKIITWNIGEDERNHKNIVNMSSYKYIKEIIEKEKVDIICFQEAITSSKDIIPIAEYVKNNTELKYSVEYEYSKSHINIGSMMGVVVCSRIPIKNNEIIKFDNPKLKYQKDENTLYVMHDKGFIVCDFSGVNLLIANGHGFPFFAFKRDALEYKYVYEKMEKELFKAFKNRENYIVLGDINYHNFKSIYPNIYANTNNNIDEYTYIKSNSERQQLDYIMTSKNIKVISSKVIDNVFDHKFGVIEIEIN
jgi:exonuclease III